LDDRGGDRSVYSITYNDKDVIIESQLSLASKSVTIDHGMSITKHPKSARSEPLGNHPFRNTLTTPYINSTFHVVDERLRIAESAVHLLKEQTNAGEDSNMCGLWQ
jgi:hypothetical protein